MTTKIQALLSELGLHGYSVIILDDKYEVQDKQTGEEVFSVDGSKMITKTTTLVELYDKLGLQGYKSQANYDALEELLHPDAWPDTQGVTIAISNSEAFLNLHDAHLIQTLFSIFEQTHEAWLLAKRKGTFRVVLI